MLKPGFSQTSSLSRNYVASNGALQKLDSGHKPQPTEKQWEAYKQKKKSDLSPQSQLEVPGFFHESIQPPSLS